MHSLASVFTVMEPYSYSQAIKQQSWIDAMHLELAALEKNGTWELITLPQGKKAIRCKWVYKTRFKPDGSAYQFKACLVAKG